MILRAINRETKTVASSALLLSASAFLSRILGLARDNLLANGFPRAATDVYFAAFRIPDFIYAILITGGITAAFLPVFSGAVKKSEKEGRFLASTVLFFFLLALIVLSIIAAFFAPEFVSLTTPGFTEAQKVETVFLARIMFLSVIFLGASAIFSSILQYLNLFFAVALAPLLYNLGIIAGIIFFAPVLGVSGIAWGVVLGAFLYLLIHLPPLCRAGFLPFLRASFFNIKKTMVENQDFRKIFSLMIPRGLGAAAYQINLIVVTAIASTLPVGSVTVFNFANNLQGVPVSLVGVSFAAAAFPFLSRSFSENNKEKFLNNFSNVFSNIFFLIAPLGCFFYLLRAQIVRLFLGTSFFGQGNFTWSDTRLTAASLGIFSISLFAAALVPFLAKVFFSMKNTKTPVKITVLSMALNIGLAYFFVYVFSFANFFRDFFSSLLKMRGIADFSLLALPLAISISVIFQFFCLALALKFRSRISFRAILETIKKTVVSSLLASFLVYLCLAVSSLVFDTGTVFGLFLQTAVSFAIGVLAYFCLSSALKIREAKRIIGLTFGLFKKHKL